jgi:hypothetical protein
LAQNSKGQWSISYQHLNERRFKSPRSQAEMALRVFSCAASGTLEGNQTPCRPTTKDNFGFYRVDDDPDELGFFCSVSQKASQQYASL